MYYLISKINGYIKYFENGGKSMYLLMKNNEVWEKYEDIRNVIKNKRNIKFHSQPIYENKCLKAKVREFNGSIKTNFLGNNVPEENTYYTCIACITLDSDIDYYPQVYLEECKYKVKKIHTPRFINTELELDSESDVEADLDSNTTIKD